MREYFWSDGTVQYPDSDGMWAFKLVELGTKRRSYKQTRTCLDYVVYWLHGYIVCRSVAQSCLTLCDLMAVAHLAPLSMGFSRQEHWSGLPCPPPWDLPDTGIEPTSLMSPALAGGFFTTSATWEALQHLTGACNF